MSSVESVAVDSAGTHAGSHVPVKALRSMALGERGDVVVVGGGDGRRRITVVVVVVVVVDQSGARIDGY